MARCWIMVAACGLIVGPVLVLVLVPLVASNRLAVPIALGLIVGPVLVPLWVCR
jgi:hypothetical protein